MTNYEMKPTGKLSEHKGKGKGPEPERGIVTDVTVETKLQVAQTDTLVALVDRVVKLHGDVARGYYDLVMWIRGNVPVATHKKFITGILLARGLKNSRVSEVIRVAGSDEKVFQPFEAKMIGFKNAVDLARKPDSSKSALPTEAAASLVGDEHITQDEADAAIREADSTPSGGKKGPAPYVATMKGLASKLAHMAIRVHIFNFSTASFRVIIEKIEKTKPAMGDDKG